MLAAARDIAAGTVLDGTVVARHVGARRRLGAGDPVRRRRARCDARPGRGRAHRGRRARQPERGARQRPTGDAPRAMSFPIPRSRAVGGALVVGDRVDVLERAPHDGAQRLRRDRRAGPRVLRRGAVDRSQGSDDASVTLAIDADARGAASRPRSKSARSRSFARPGDAAAAPVDPAADIAPVVATAGTAKP